MNHGQRLAAFAAADLYVVITASFCAGRPVPEVLQKTLAAGVKIVQMREKEMSGRGLYEMAKEFRRLTEAAGALLIIDDRLDIALAAAADGVHLGQEDLPIEVARRLAPELIVGASTHSLEEALAAQDAGASYVNIGPIFATQTKPTMTPLGPETIDRIAPRLQIPWTTMGGINLANISQVVAHGARHPAVMSAVTAAADPQAAASALRQIILAGEESKIL
ncbi:MAG: thiamine phosphate synthase [Deltaproteobacteria bacterium]|nr:thiamine phosphate synthase [Deltaproteobacteria bacterium]MBI4795057.1 thiamine phosphate synthase [Deltaproteobacteria bacterium]